MTEGSAFRNARTELSRDEWLDRLTHLRIKSYEAMISKISVGRDEAVVTLNESWSIQSAQGSRLEKRFAVSDTWLKREGTWKLTRRLCQSDVR